MLDRRSLLAGCAASTVLAPWALGFGPAASKRSLVLLQLSGGNDGLSTVVPFGDDGYARAREATRHQRRDLVRLDGYRGLHAALAGLGREWDAGRLAVVEGVGYPDMVRSHFRAFEVWHTADRRGRAAGDGWIGRLAAQAWAAEDHPDLVVHFGLEAPWSLHSSAHPPVTLVSPTSYRWFGDEDTEATMALAGEALEPEEEGKSRHRGRDQALARLRGVLDDARVSSSSIRAAAERYRTPVEYPRDPLAASLRDVAALIEGGVGSRVYSVVLRGFDTHADQKADHDALMRTLDGCLGAFLADLRRSEAGRETVVLVFSEFGRRVQENASQGTDHGKAGPLFVCGAPVQGGLYGEHPSLSELDEGDLAWTTDFRSVYGELIEGWFGTPMETVLGARYPRLGCL
ncbi:MAG: DUF1501 domain-containing protein, partial [Planctomycetota bacterium]|nr:DUF1501 domain-containing protein [Planctomycetota bacterium]